MKQYCVDTNAILDICYRYYPKSHFPNIWEGLKIAVLSRHIKLFVTYHIFEEVNAKIVQFKLDIVNFEEFIEEFDIQIIPLIDYEQKLAKLKADILSANPSFINSKAFMSSAHDLSNICAMRDNGVVITAESTIGVDLHDPSYLKKLKNPKIPDICRYFDIECENWLPILDYIGFR